MKEKILAVVAAFSVTTAILVAVNVPSPSLANPHPKVSLSPIPIPSTYQPLYNELTQTDLPHFDNVIASATPSVSPLSTPIYGGQLNPAESLLGPGLQGAGNLAGVAQWLSMLRSFGAQEATVHVDFPLLSYTLYNWSGHPCSAYDPKNPSTTGCADLNWYINYYATVAQMARNLGLKLIVETQTLLDGDGSSTLPTAEAAYWQSVATGMGTGVTQLQAYYRTLFDSQGLSGGPNYAAYGQDRGDQAALIAEIMAPNYISVIFEPDSESRDADNMPNLATLAGSTQNLSYILNEYQSDKVGYGSGFPTGVYVGAGVGTWIVDNSVPPNHYKAINYIQSFISTSGTTDGENPLKLSFVDMHMLPMVYDVTPPTSIDLFGQANSIASFVNAAPGNSGHRIRLGITESWAHKESAAEMQSESQTATTNYRDNYNFFRPVDQWFLDDQYTFTNIWGFDFVTSSFPQFFNAYLNWNSNYYSTTCPAPLPSLSVSQMDAAADYSDIVNCGSQTGINAITTAQYSAIGLDWYQTRVSSDLVPPPSPSPLAGQGGYGTATLWWNGAISQSMQFPAQDNVGTAYYVVTRNGTTVTNTDNWLPYVPSPLPSPWPSAWPSSLPYVNYQDTGLAAGSYTYGIKAVDRAGNVSGMTTIPITVYSH